jgi:DNA repair protein RadC
MLSSLPKAFRTFGSSVCNASHNHPTGDLTPSSEDIAITRRLKEAGELLGVRVLDHIIVDTDTGNSSSFAEKGLM